MAVREFATAVIKPMAPRTDHEHRYPAEILSAAAELDLMGILVPSEYGGAGLDHVAFAICIEEIATACASTAVLVDVHNSVASEPILIFGDEEQKRSWLPRLARGEILGAFALTEPSSGSDAAALKTTAKRFGDEFVLNGTKVFITGVGHAGMYLVFAHTDPAGPGRARGVGDVRLVWLRCPPASPVTPMQSDGGSPPGMRPSPPRRSGHGRRRHARPCGPNHGSPRSDRDSAACSQWCSGGERSG